VLGVNCHGVDVIARADIIQRRLYVFYAQFSRYLVAPFLVQVAQDDMLDLGVRLKQLGKLRTKSTHTNHTNT
jgi:hypothetical protein